MRRCVILSVRGKLSRFWHLAIYEHASSIPLGFHCFCMTPWPLLSPRTCPPPVFNSNRSALNGITHGAGRLRNCLLDYFARSSSGCFRVVIYLYLFSILLCCKPRSATYWMWRSADGTKISRVHPTLTFPLIQHHTFRHDRPPSPLLNVLLFATKYGTFHPVNVCSSPGDYLPHVTANQ